MKSGHGILPQRAAVITPRRHRQSGHGSGDVGAGDDEKGCRSRAEQGRRFIASEAWWYAKGALQALAHAKDVLIGKFQLEDAPGFEGGGEQAIKGKLGTIVRTPMRILSRQTNLMYTLNYFGELNAQAARAAIGEGLKGDELYARQSGP